MSRITEEGNSIVFNVSNQSYTDWDTEQLEGVKDLIRKDPKYEGESISIIDIPFPRSENIMKTLDSFCDYYDALTHIVKVYITGNNAVMYDLIRNCSLDCYSSVSLKAKNNKRIYKFYELIIV